MANNLCWWRHFGTPKIKCQRIEICFVKLYEKEKLSRMNEINFFYFEHINRQAVTFGEELDFIWQVNLINVQLCSVIKNTPETWYFWNLPRKKKNSLNSGVICQSARAKLLASCICISLTVKQQQTALNTSNESTQTQHHFNSLQLANNSKGGKNTLEYTWT